VAPGSDTWQAVLEVLAYRWTYLEVTHVTTRRVTCGTNDVAGDRAVWQGWRGKVTWHDVAVIYWQVLSELFADTWRLFGK
jgi:hypothetical protein